MSAAGFPDWGAGKTRFERVAAELKRRRQAKPGEEGARHDYEPSDEKPRPMSSEPPCVVCGNSRDSFMHTAVSR